MSDTIKTTLELGGITMKYGDYGECIKVSRTTGCCVTYNLNYEECLLVSSDFSKPFYIECTDDPSKLHKFCEMKYLGLVDNPHYKGVGDMLREMVKKFDGCLVYSNGNNSTLVTKKHLFRLGCMVGVMQVLGHVLTGIYFPSGSRTHEVSFHRIDALKMADSWFWASSYEQHLRDVIDQLKDVEP